MARPLLTLLALLLLAGCHAAPSLRVDRVKLQPPSSDGYVLDFTIEATNTNPFELPLLTVNYELWLEGERVFEGRRSGEATLRREGAQMLELPAAVALGEGEGAPTGVIPYRLRGTISYVAPGALAQSLFDARLLRPSVRFDERGEIDFGAEPQAPAADAPAG